MPVSAKQLNLCDVSKDFHRFYSQNENNLLTLLDEHINISNFIPFSFYQRYYSKSGIYRDFSLESFLCAFILKNLLSIPSINLLISFLNISAEMRNFCRFLRVPNKSQFSRFKSNFFDDLNDIFNNLVDITEELSLDVNPFLASILVTDTTGFEAYVAENNPKYYQSILRKAKAYSKYILKDNSNSAFDAEKYAQGQMPKSASANPDTKLTYLNGHFEYFQKCVVTTNALGIVRNINFYDSNNKLELNLSPQEIKDSYDAKSLIPALETYFQLHPNFSYNYFLGDAGFDADDNYAYLRKRSIMPIISLNPRSDKSLPQPGFNEIGIPLCPYDSSLPIIYDGITTEKNRADRIKYICPKALRITSNGKHL